MGVGYARGNTVYAFFVTQRGAELRVGGDAELRVYETVEAFTSSTPDTEILRLRCAPSSVIADSASIAP